MATVQVIKEIVGLIKELVTFFAKARREGWIKEGKDLAVKINQAKTDQDRKKLVLALARYASRKKV